MSSNFDTDLAGWTNTARELPSISFEDMVTARLEKGKTYKIEYTLIAGNASDVNIVPKFDGVFSLNSISCREIIPDEPKQDKQDVPKGMSPSYFHLMQKEKNNRRKRRKI